MTAAIPAAYLLALPPGWTPAHVERFDGDDFRALYAAAARVSSLEMSGGATQAEAPIAVFKGLGVSVSKWHGLSPEERAQMDGAIIGDKRNGPVWLLLREVPHAR